MQRPADAIPKETHLVIGLLVIASLLRITHLNGGLWFDEIVTLIEFIRLPAGDLLTTYGSLNNHLLYTWAAKVTTGIFGEAPWVIRLPAALFGIASIWVCWRLIRETGFQWVALMTAALLVVSYHHVWFSQNARGYTGMFLFTSLAALAMARGLNTKKLEFWALYALCAAAALFTHLSSAFLLLAQGVTVLGFGFRDVFINKSQPFWSWLKGPLIGMGGGVALAILLYAPLLPGLVETFSAYDTPMDKTASAGVTEWKNPVWTLFEIFRSFGAVGYAIPVAGLFAVLGAWRLARTNPIIAIPFLVHIPLTIIILMLASFRIWPRYFFVDIGFLFACAVLGAYLFADYFVRLVPEKLRLGLDATALKVIGSVLMVLASLPLLLGNYAAPKQDFIGAQRLIATQAEPEDTIVTLGLADIPYGSYLAPDWPAIQTADELTFLLSNTHHVWLITAFPAHTRSHFPAIANQLETDFEQVERFGGTVSGGDVIVYRSRQP